MRWLPLLLIVSPAIVFADDDAPSLEVRTDEVAHGHPHAASSADAVAIVFGEYAVGLHFAVHPRVALSITPGWRNAPDRHGPRLGLGVELLPMGQALQGPLVAAGVVGAWLPGDEASDRVELGVTAHAGYRYVWRGVLLEGSLGAERRFRLGHQPGRSWRPIVRLALGFSWG